jgi:hypothetical protein
VDKVKVGFIRLDKVVILTSFLLIFLTVVLLIYLPAVASGSFTFLPPASASSQQLPYNANLKSELRQTETGGYTFVDMSGQRNDLSDAFRPPMSVVVGNTFNARPIIGVSDADIVFETVIENSATRMLAVYQSSDPYEIVPVRSTREYFAQISDTLNFNLIYNGFSDTPSEYLTQIETNTLNLQEYDELYFSIPGKPEESSLGIFPEEVREQLYNNEGLQPMFPVFQYEEEQFDTNQRILDQEVNIDIPFEDLQPYKVVFDYLIRSNEYIREVGGSVDIDGLTGNAVTVKNVLVLRTPIEDIPNDVLRRKEIQLSSGEGILFKNGSRIDINYILEEGTVKLTDSFGNPVRLVRGKAWVTIVDINTPIESNEKR